MITNGWVAWAERKAGPGNKVYPIINKGAGVCWHSMEGWYTGSMAELMNLDRAASWMFSLRTDGSLVQHYPITASCWASGNRWANTNFWSVELEGVFTMPINGMQSTTALRLIEEWEAHTGLVAKRGAGATMVEHREVATLETPNAGPTACPSERYATLWAALEGDDDVGLVEKVARLERILAANGINVNGPDAEGNLPPDTFGEDALAHLDANGSSIALLAAIANQRVAGVEVEQDALIAALEAHTANHPGGGEVGPHVHHQLPVTGEVKSP